MYNTHDYFGEKINEKIYFLFFLYNYSNTVFPSSLLHKKTRYESSCKRFNRTNLKHGI